MQICQILTNQIWYETKTQMHHISMGFILGMQCWYRASQEVVMVKSLLVNVGYAERPAYNPWVRKIPWRRKWQTTPVFLSVESHGERNLPHKTTSQNNKLPYEENKHFTNSDF